MNWIKKNIGLLLSVLLMTVTVAIFGPIELYFANSEEFWFSLKDVVIISVILAVLFAVVLTGVGVLLPGKARDIYSCILFALGLALYIQGNYANIDYGVLDGTAVDWGSYRLYGILDTFGWLVLLAAAIILLFKKRKLFTAIQKYASLFIVAMQVLTLVILLVTSTGATQEKSGSYLSSDGLLDLGKEDNIIIFVLDAFDDTYFQEVLKQEPEKYQETFQDFVYFSNASVAAARTKAALPAIISGEPYPGEISYAEYIEQSFDSDGMYSELRDQNYDVRIYTEPLFVPDGSSDFVANQTTGGYRVTSYPKLSKTYLILTLYKYMPHYLKQYFWLYTGDFNQYKEGNSAAGYQFDDVTFFADLQQEQLQISNAQNAFRLYHLSGSHPPYYYNESVQRVTSDETNVIRQSMGSLQIIDAYMEQMKKLGIYDDATIIIMADHGDANDDYGIKNAAHGILLVKEQGAGRTFSESTAPVSYFDLHSTIFSALGTSNGETFFDIAEDADRVRNFYLYYSKNGSFVVDEYTIHGHINDKDSLTPTGKTIAPVQEIIPYQYGVHLTFGEGGTVAQYILSGVSATDLSSYVWTDGMECSFEFPLETLPEKNLLVTIDVMTPYTAAGPQQVIAYANGTPCHQEVLSTETEMKIIVPGSVISESKKLELKLLLPNAVSPAAIHGEGHDVRTLALALRGLRIEETDLAAEIIDYSGIILNSELLLAQDYTENVALFQTGLSSPESGHTWTDGTHATLIANIGQSVEQGLNCTLQLVSVYNGHQTVKITANGAELFHKELGADDQTISFDIPQNCITDGTIILNFEFPDAASPAQLGTGADRRVLALALKSIRFSETEE